MHGYWRAIIEHINMHSARGNELIQDFTELEPQRMVKVCLYIAPRIYHVNKVGDHSIQLLNVGLLYKT